MNRMHIFLASAAALLIASVAAAQPVSRTANNGNLIMEDVPEIPAEIVDSLNRYQNVRSASFRDWTADGQGILISTRFGDVSQLHRVDMPGGARHQITFYDEPIGGVTRQPAGRNVIFTRDAGGSEFSQVFILDPVDGTTTMLTDGESRNGGVSWDREGRRIAFTSTARNGASNDVWMMDPEDPDSAEIVLESPDGTAWSAVEFSDSGSKVLISNYVSIADSRVNLLDLDTGNVTLLAGGPENRSANQALAFDDDNDGLWFITDQGSEFRRLAWQSAEPGAGVEIVTTDLSWDVSGAEISNDRRRIAFSTNEGGMSRVYLMDTRTRAYRVIDTIPTGLAFGLTFSPDDRRLAMTLNTPSTPSDVFILDLGNDPLEYGALTRWTTSEVGGLDTTQFRVPELVSYPTCLLYTSDAADEDCLVWLAGGAGS